MQPSDATLDDVAAFVRDYTGLGPRRVVTPETRLDTDLGVTGDDGLDLIKAAERRFGVVLISEVHGVREAFGLGPDEVLFGPEGFDLIGWVVGWLLDWPRPVVVRDLTIAELHRAVSAAQQR